MSLDAVILIRYGTYRIKATPQSIRVEARRERRLTRWRGVAVSTDAAAA
jgi:hypothetical protein